MNEIVSPDDSYSRKRVTVRDSEMAYIDSGNGKNCLFLHGNPTSSYLRRNIISHVDPIARCIAPVHVGMGESAESPRHNYQLFELAAYLDAFVEAVEITNDSGYGLAGWVYASSVERARETALKMRTGRVYLNGAPPASDAPVRWIQRVRQWTRRRCVRLGSVPRNKGLVGRKLEPLKLAKNPYPYFSGTSISRLRISLLTVERTKRTRPPHSISRPLTSTTGEAGVKTRRSAQPRSRQLLASPCLNSY